MPIYEYACTKCKHRFELIQKFSARKVRTCPECKGKVERLVHAPAIQFKGTGWYVTDYAGKSGGVDRDAPKKSDGDSKKRDSKKSDTKSKPKKSSED